MKSIGCVWVLLTLAACATAGTQPGDDDDDVIDAPTGGAIDAYVPPATPDAFVPPGTPDARPPGTPDAYVPPPPIDAAVPPPIPDAAIGGFCADDSTCAPGECCFPPGGSGLCVPGMTIPGIGCFPSG